MHRYGCDRENSGSVKGVRLNLWKITGNSADQRKVLFFRWKSVAPKSAERVGCSPSLGGCRAGSSWSLSDPLAADSAPADSLLNTIHSHFNYFHVKYTTFYECTESSVEKSRLLTLPRISYL